ncbi:phosphoribosylamine--glycine ligase [Bibersteinia trehalosi]|uniref:phosphoribosylamine--glycine ligase n=1 Tax=Bibersteinia trehalosi TaxID=47735 RepID=UPI00104AA75C|nr:phosphoribosylamine--glycine ligase [Bibersteinia trehalosi]TCT18588.1 phosphoribosylamine--glycine ligase [Bibersteinia trehalosi]
MNNVLIIGSGGREHAIAKAFERSPKVANVFVAPGNAGMPSSKIECVNIGITDFPALRQFVAENHIAFTFVGPEVPLSEGIVDDFNAHHLPIVGPTQYAAQMESSKAFAKGVMDRANVPTASYQSFSAKELEKATAYLESQSMPIVIKQDGLAAGKGVVIAQTLEEAKNTVREMMIDLNSPVVIEEFMTGEELSFFILVNGEHIIPIGFARDYKRAYDNDEGSNTGGMGAYSPLQWVDSAIEQEIMNKVLRPLLAQLVKEGTPYTGVLYAGLMQTQSGIKVIEFNARFGDPETQILLPLIETDFFDLVSAHLAKSDIDVKLSNKTSLGVIVAAEGYPQDYAKGMKIHFADDFPMENVCFAGVAEKDGKLTANGGRILMVTTQQDDLISARKAVYELLEKVKIEKSFYRRDIGFGKDLQRN